jgi:hypothetical protein
VEVAPLALFAYARPDHLRRAVESLRRNPEALRSDLHVFCDGAKSPQSQPAVDAVRRYVDTIDGFASVTAVHRPSNFGLARSIVSGVGAVLEGRERVIVLEDDLVVSPQFLRYMNEGLELYANDDRVASIHGYTYPVADSLPETFFLRGADCWGWATWRRAWQGFRSDGESLLAELRERGLTREFDLDGAYSFTRMLANQVAGRNDSWAVRWHASCYLADKLTLYPGRSLVHNIGNDSSGTHSKATRLFDVELPQREVAVERIALDPSPQAREAFKRFLSPSLFRKLRGAWHAMGSRLGGGAP